MKLGGMVEAAEMLVNAGTDFAVVSNFEVGENIVDGKIQVVEWFQSHLVTPVLLRNQTESQVAEITQLIFGWTQIFCGNVAQFSIKNRPCDLSILHQVCLQKHRRPR